MIIGSKDFEGVPQNLKPSGAGWWEPPTFDLQPSVVVTPTTKYDSPMSIAPIIHSTSRLGGVQSGTAAHVVATPITMGHYNNLTSSIRLDTLASLCGILMHPIVSCSPKALSSAPPAVARSPFVPMLLAKRFKPFSTHRFPTPTPDQQQVTPLTAFSHLSRPALSALLLAGGTALTIAGSHRDVALLVVAGVAVIGLGLKLLTPLARRTLDWMDRRGF